MKSIKKMLAAFIVLCMMSLALVGCTNKEVIVATINGEPISQQLYRINLWSTQRGLESIQENYWSLESIYGQSPEEYAKAKTLRAVTYCVVVEQKAKELDIKLTKDERAKVKEAAKKAMETDKDFAKAYDITQKDYEKYYTFAAQNKKVLQILADSYEPNDQEVQSEIAEMRAEGKTKDEAKIVQILFKTKNDLGEEIPEDKKQEIYEKAQVVLQKALDGEEITELAKSYSDDESVGENSGEYTFSRGGEVDDNLSNAVFDQAEVGKVYPELIETAYGYEIVKVLEVNKESEEEIKSQAVEEIKTQYAQKELEEMTGFAEVQKTEEYDNIHTGPLDIARTESDQTIK